MKNYIRHSQCKDSISPRPDGKPAVCQARSAGLERFHLNDTLCLFRFLIEISSGTRRCSPHIKQRYSKTQDRLCMIKIITK